MTSSLWFANIGTFTLGVCLPERCFKDLLMARNRITLWTLAAAGTMLAVRATGRGRRTSTPPVNPMQPLDIGSLSIGTGRPKIIVSSSGAQEASVLQDARRIAIAREADMMELRVDKLDFALDGPRVATLGNEASRALGGKPLLLTFRTKQEGGSRAISDSGYTELYRHWIEAGFASLIDVEMMRGDDNVRALVEEAHTAGIPVILSSHDFQKTPSDKEMLARLAKQRALGADVLKLAVMPRSAEDVLRLLKVTDQARRQGRTPLLTMAMGGLGTVSRLSGETFGSSLTFGSLGQGSAPGQIDAGVLRHVLDALHQANKVN